jgi:AhpD family alkylhydroperoxidase
MDQETTLDELLDAQIVRQLMLRDGVQAQEVRELMEAARRRGGDRQSHGATVIRPSAWRCLARVLRAATLCVAARAECALSPPLPTETPVFWVLDAFRLRISTPLNRRMTMAQRLNPFKVAPDTVKAVVAVDKIIADSGLEKSLLELVKMRASQINGCTYCLHAHASDARKAGETEMRLYLLNGWRESSLYSDRERAALAWTEALTLVASKGAPEQDFALLAAQFNEAEQANLTMAIGAINLWNRLQIGVGATHPPIAQTKPA